MKGGHQATGRLPSLVGSLSMEHPADRTSRRAARPWVFSLVCLVIGVIALVQGARVSAAILLVGVLLHLLMVISRGIRWHSKADRPAH
jgi:hypothetical protein